MSNVSLPASFISTPRRSSVRNKSATTDPLDNEQRPNQPGAAANEDDEDEEETDETDEDEDEDLDDDSDDSDDDGDEDDDDDSDESRAVARAVEAYAHA